MAEEIYSTQAPPPNLDPNDPRPIDSFILLIHNFIYITVLHGAVMPWCALAHGAL